MVLRAARADEFMGVNVHLSFGTRDCVPHRGHSTDTILADGTQQMEIRNVEQRRLRMAIVNLSQTLGERGLPRTFSLTNLFRLY